MLLISTMAVGRMAWAGAARARRLGRSFMQILRFWDFLGFGFWAEAAEIMIFELEGRFIG